TVRAGLVAVAPHFDFATVYGEGDLAADGRRGFLPAALVGTERAIDVVEPHHAGLQTVVFGVVPAQTLREELLPAVPIFRVGGVRVFFLQRGHGSDPLEVLRIHARRGAEQEAPYAALASGFQHVGVDQDIVVHDLGLVGLDEADPPHVGGQAIDLVHRLGSCEAVLPATEIKHLELVSGRRLELRYPEIHASHPMPEPSQMPGEMVADETARAGDQHAWLPCHELALRSVGSILANRVTPSSSAPARITNNGLFRRYLRHSRLGSCASRYAHSSPARFSIRGPCRRRPP